MKHKIYLATILAAGLLCSSCEDFLDQRPQSVASTANFYKNDADIENAVNACYASLQNSKLYGNFMIVMAEVRSDNVEDQNPGGNAGRDYNIDHFTAGADNAAVTGVWQQSFHTIMRCNAVLENLDACKNESKRKQYEGEARFLRGLMYFNIVRFWGAAPIVRNQLTIDQSIASVREDVDKVYAFIEEDLASAAANLPAKYGSKETGRASSGAALALLGKVYLTQQRWIEAKATLGRLLSSEFNSVYELLPDVADVFKQDNKFNKEQMFVVHYSKTIVGEGHGFSQYFQNASLLDIKLRTGYEENDARKRLIETYNLDKDTSPFMKFYDTYDPSTKNVGYDMSILRYADVILMYAEALNEIGYDSSADSEALAYLNKVRTRSGATAYKATELANQAAFRDAVLLERRLEFPLELHRWFDLIRTNTAEEALAKVGHTITRNDYLYPIPKTELDLVPNFYQNPGYADK